MCILEVVCSIVNKHKRTNQVNFKLLDIERVKGFRNHKGRLNATTKAVLILMPTQAGVIHKANS